MTNKFEKTYLILLVVLLIVCIILTMFVCQRNNEGYNKDVKINIIQTEGDIKSFQRKIDNVFKTLDDDTATYSTYSLESNLNQSLMSPNDWVKLGDYINSVYDIYDSFIIIHPDSTLTYSASALSYMLENISKPVILTSSSILNNDADILTSLRYACELKIPEVVIMSDNKIHRGCCSYKINTDSFTSIGIEPLAISKTNIEVNKGIILKIPTVRMIYKPFNTQIHVVVIKLFPGITGDYINKTLGNYPIQGIVFELIGNGESPSDESFLNAIDNLYKKKILMIGIPQLTNDKLKDFKISNNIEKRGIVNGYSMTVESAVCKLYYIISNTSKFEDAMSLVSIPLRGEINK